MGTRSAVKTGVVLAQMGGPGCVADVEPFIRSVFCDPDVVSLPGGRVGRELLGALIAKTRGAKVRDAYRRIGGGSPIRATTERQAVALRAELAARGSDVPVAVAMRYTQPDVVTALGALVEQGVGRLVVLPLFPHYGRATTGSSEAEVRRVAEACYPGIEVAVVRSWWHVPSFLDLQVASVLSALDELGETNDGSSQHATRRGRAGVLISAHGVPQRSVDDGDPYIEDVEASAAAIAARIPTGIESRLGYQSRSGPVRWAGPDVRQVIVDLVEQGVSRLAVLPISFVSDHLETLHEIDIVLRTFAEKAGIESFARAPVLNDGPEAGPVLADAMESLL